MGDINFNIAKDVNLNKQVQLDIQKNVNANVNNPDQLATAEADAEAFGPNALAEVDAYTLVTPPEDVPNGDSDEGAIDAVGNTNPLTTSSDSPIQGGDGVIPTNITVDLTSVGDLPDVDDINASGSLASLDGSVTNDTPISATDALEFSDDLNLTFVQEIGLADPESEAGEYSLDNDIVINFGNQDLDLNGDGTSTSGELTLSIQAGATFLVEQLENGELELEFQSDSPVWNHPDINVIPSNATAFVLDSEDAGIGFADWAFQAGIFDEINDIPGEGGTAFAYAESTSALDLNPGAGVEPEPSVEIG